MNLKNHLTGQRQEVTGDDSVKPVFENPLIWPNRAIFGKARDTVANSDSSLQRSVANMVYLPTARKGTDTPMSLSPGPRGGLWIAQVLGCGAQTHTHSSHFSPGDTSPQPDEAHAHHGFIIHHLQEIGY